MEISHSLFFFSFDIGPDVGWAAHERITAYAVGDIAQIVVITFGYGSDGKF